MWTESAELENVFLELCTGTCGCKFSRLGTNLDTGILQRASPDESRSHRRVGYSVSECMRCHHQLCWQQMPRQLR